MKVLQECLLVVHFVGLASLLGGFLTQMAAETRRVVPAMLHGAATMLVSGLLLWWVDKSGLHYAVSEAKLITKLAVLVVIMGLIWVNRTKDAIGKGVYLALGGLTLANVVVAVFWR